MDIHTYSNLMMASSMLVFMVLPIAALVFAIVTRKKYWIAAVTIVAFCIFINVALFINSLTCQGGFCGLGNFFMAIIASVFLGIIAFVVALISAPKVFLLVISIPILAIVSYSAISNYAYFNREASASIRMQRDTNEIISVAILSQPPSFYAPTDVFPKTVRFGSKNATSIRTSIQDVNNDKVSDLIFYFNVSQTGIQPGDTQACLTGRDRFEERIKGCKEITTEIGKLN